MARTAIVTGADSGIGKATAVHLARQGCDVGITYRSDEEGARGTAAEVEALGRRADVRHLDLSDPATGPLLVDGQAAARRMVAAGRGGRIVNVTSVHEHVPLEGSSAYCAAKGGLGLLTKVMALELAPHGITVNAVAPGEIATAMTGNEDTDPGTVERPGIPLGRPGHAREIAAAVAWLASEEASYATGASFVVDGGLLLMAAKANADTAS